MVHVSIHLKELAWATKWLQVIKMSFKTVNYSGYSLCDDCTCMEAFVM